MERVLQEAWFHNIHRGHASAGFFYFPLGSDELVTYKSPGQADEVFEADFKGKKGMLEVARTFGAHTREPSIGKGKPKFNENNHPVDYRGVYVNHNGNVANDAEIKASIKGKKKDIPEVDSVAIPIVLSDVTNPASNALGLKNALEELEGDFTFHAVWEDVPGFSLIVRGKGKTLVVAKHESNGGALFYGSEIESVWHMIRMLDLDPSHEGWTWRKMDWGTFMLVQDGQVIDWGDFKPKTFSHSNKLDFYMKRYLPAESDGEFYYDKQLVYLTDLSYDYINKIGSFSMLDKKVKEEKIVYARLDYPEKTFPTTDGETDSNAVLVEADRVVKNGDMLHAFYGDIEIVMTSGRIVRDVFNHALFKNEDRWVRQDKISDTEITDIITSREQGDGTTWNAFFHTFKKTTGIKPNDLPKQLVPYKYLKEADKGKANGQTTRNGGNSQGISSNKPFDKGLAEMETDILLGWDNTRENQGVYAINQRTTPHISDPQLTFIHDANCATHNEKFSQHEFPRECKAVLLGASFTLAAFNDLTLWYYFQGEFELEWDMAGNGFCSENACQFIESEYVKVKTDKSFWAIMTAEECWTCGGIRRLKYLPEWFKELDTSNRLDLFLTYGH